MGGYVVFAYLYPKGLVKHCLKLGMTHLLINRGIYGHSLNHLPKVLYFAMFFEL